MSADRFARSFGRVAETYERGRPGWSEEALDRASGELGLGPDATVLDLAAGTGKLTRQLVPRFARVIAVEPVDELRALLERLVPGAEALDGTAEAIPVSDDSVDAVFVGEAFHWFARPEPVAEIARVLRSRGGLVLLWNRGPRPEPALPDTFWETYAQERLDRPAAQLYESSSWRDAFAGSAFAELREESFPNEFRVDREGLIDYIGSYSSVAALPAARRTALLGRLRALASGDDYTVSLRTELCWTRLRG